MLDCPDSRELALEQMKMTKIDIFRLVTKLLGS
jgi:hypothetical protein